MEEVGTGVGAVEEAGGVVERYHVALRHAERLAILIIDVDEAVVDGVEAAVGLVEQAYPDEACGVSSDTTDLLVVEGVWVSELGLEDSERVAVIAVEPVESAHP